MSWLEEEIKRQFEVQQKIEKLFMRTTPFPVGCPKYYIDTTPMYPGDRCVHFFKDWSEEK